MAIALTPFSALCGFLPIDRIASYLKVVPEFAGLIPEPVRRTFIASASSHAAPREAREALKGLFTSLMTTDESRFGPALKVLVERYEGRQESEVGKQLEDLVIRLHNQFPGDVGVFCPFILNYVELEKGEAIFLGAGEPHAYVSGGGYWREKRERGRELTRLFRYNGMHGDIRQCYPRRAHAKVARCPESCLQSDIRFGRCEQAQREGDEIRVMLLHEVV